MAEQSKLQPYLDAHVKDNHGELKPGQPKHVFNLVLQVEIQKVWEIVGNFSEIKRIKPLIESLSSTGNDIGATRDAVFAKVAAPLISTSEKLTILDPHKHVIGWETTSSVGFPFKSSKEVISLHSSGPRTLLIWSTVYDPVNEADVEQINTELTTDRQIATSQLRLLLWDA